MSTTAAHLRERLRLTKRFLAIQRRGSWARAPLLSIGILPNQLPTTRVGLRTQRGMKGATTRNRIKRLFRVVYQQHKTELVCGYDIVVVLHRTAPPSLKQLEIDFIALCRRLELLMKPSP